MRSAAALTLPMLLATAAALGQGYTVTLPDPPAQKGLTIHTTDLYYAPWDWDDLNDATIWYALGKEFADVKAFVMDEPFSGWTGDIASRGDGRTWQGIYNIAVGTDVPYYSGLPSFLASPADDGQSQPAFHHQGRDAILNVLSASPDESVVLHAVGSMRDIAAAYNHDPGLFVQKVSRIYSSGGREGDFRDANWGSDPNAAICLLNSGVPMYVAFCGEGTKQDGAYWPLDIPALVNLTDTVNPKLSQVVHWGYYGAMDGGYRSVHGIGFPNRPFLPAGIAPPDRFTGNNTMANPQAFFDEPTLPAIDAEIRTPGLTKAMWSPINFLDSVGLRVFRQGGLVELSYEDDMPGWERVCFFRPARFTLNGYNFYYEEVPEDEANVHIFHWETAAKSVYQGVMNAVYRKLVETYLVGENPQFPHVDYEIRYLGDGLYGVSFTVDGNDGQQKSFFADMSFEGAGGGQIQQTRAIIIPGVLAYDIDAEADANLYDGQGTPPYEKDRDSYFLEPFSDGDVMALDAADNYYHIEAGTGAGGQYQDAPLAYVVTTGDLAYYGVISRLAKNYGATGIVEMPPPGDANLDGLVNGGDYTIWCDNYSATDLGWAGADFNGSGIVDGGDYTIWADNYGAGAAAAGVPAPAALWLLGAGSTCLLRRRRGRFDAQSVDGLIRLAEEQLTSSV